ncbi:hypothetical protein ARMGADRAFT_1029451 [Armillaria gallica]|uniref:Uncharacterized protein n=1 Tax=Armillaria gallica TaxID=47427 RepID=A0A2H3DS79_ARMGA|nr:hypothetical protein ARMGADRAFT_1029451 [Armillaria gallica]
MTGQTSEGGLFLSESEVVTRFVSLPFVPPTCIRASSVPMELVEPKLHQLWMMNGHMTDEVMRQELHKVFDTKKYCLGIVSIDTDMAYLCTIYPTAGHTEMHKHLKHICGILAPEYLLLPVLNCEFLILRGVVEEWFQMKEPVLFPGVLKWINMWWNNSNLVLISHYYLDMVEQTGGPLLTQSDLGNENGHLARAHTFLRHTHDPALIGTVQHCWMREKKNLPAKIIWSVLRRSWLPGFEHLLQTSVPLCVSALASSRIRCICFREQQHKKSHNRKIARPNGIPLLIEQAPECFGTQDFKVAFTSESIAAAWAIYAPPDHPVLKLVPHSFAVLAHEYLEQLRHPIINKHSIWNMYLALLGMFWANNILTPEEWENLNEEEELDAQNNHLQANLHTNFEKRMVNKTATMTTMIFTCTWEHQSEGFVWVGIGSIEENQKGESKAWQQYSLVVSISDELERRGGRGEEGVLCTYIEEHNQSSRGGRIQERHMTYIFMFKDGLDPLPPLLLYMEVIFTYWDSLVTQTLVTGEMPVCAGVLPIVAGWLPYLTSALLQ